MPTFCFPQAAYREMGPGIVVASCNFFCTCRSTLCVSKYAKGASAFHDITSSKVFKANLVVVLAM